MSASLSITPAGGGLLRYEYEITVDPLSSFAAIDLAIDTVPGVDLTLFSSPANWDLDYQDGAPLVFWSAPLDGSGDILPGTSGVFSFVSSFLPSLQTYSMLGIDSSTFDFDLASGIIDAPSLAGTNNDQVPEPGSLLAWAGLGLLGLLSGNRVAVRQRVRNEWGGFGRASRHGAAAD